MEDIIVRGTKKTEKKVDVVVSSAELEKIVSKGLLDTYPMITGIRNAFLIQIGIGTKHERVYINKNGEWEYSWEVRGGSHGWDDEEVIRPATENEKIFEQSLTAIEHAFTVARLEGESVGN